MIERFRLTDRAIKKWLASGTSSLARDTQHGQLRIRAHADRSDASWQLVTHKRGRTQIETLGHWQALPANVLLPQLSEKLAAHAVGRDCVINTFSTVQHVLDWYGARITAERDLSSSTIANTLSAIDCHLSPRLGELPLSDLTGAAIDDRLIVPLKSKLKIGTVEGIFKKLKAAFNMASRQNRLTRDPLAGITFDQFTKSRSKPASPLLHPEDLPRLVERLNRANIHHAMLASMMLLHGSRISETRLAEWSHISFEDRTWRIPAENTKTGEAHCLPLTDVSIALLKNYKGKTGTRRFLFSAGAHPLSASAAGQWFRQLRGRHDKWTSHHIRKLARTCWSQLGIEYWIGERLVNHKLRGLDATYIDARYVFDNMRKALELWHGELAELGLLQTVTTHVTANSEAA